MVVEDDAAIREVLAELLHAEGHAVILAVHGEDAMRLLHDGPPPCLMVVDLLMPVLDGWGLAAGLAADAQLASIPFVVLTAQPASGSVNSPRGARALLTKPVALDRLLATVDEHCGIAGMSAQ